MKRTFNGFNIARSQMANDDSINPDHEILRYHLQAARYRDEVNSVLDFTRGKNSHYYFKYKRKTDQEVA